MLDKKPRLRKGNRGQRTRWYQQLTHLQGFAVLGASIGYKFLNITTSEMVLDEDTEEERGPTTCPKSPSG